MHKTYLVTVLLGYWMICLPAQGLELPKVPKSGRLVPKGAVRSPKPTLNPAHQQALAHAQALREIQAARLSTSAFARVSHRTAAAPVPKPISPLQLEELERKINALQNESIRKVHQARWQQHWILLPENKTPQMWLSLLEDYTAQYGKFPSPKDDSKVLYEGYIQTVSQLGERHPISLSMRALQAQYPCTTPSPTP